MTVLKYWDGTQWQVARNFGGVSVVTTLPATPYNGQEVLYKFTQAAVPADARTIFWHLRYDATLNAWFPVGGATPLLASVVTASGENAPTTYGAVTTAGPAIALPLAGDYDVQTSFAAFHSSTNAIMMSYDIGATAAADADAVAVHAGIANTIQRATRTKRKTGLSAVTLTAKYRAAATGTVAGTGNIAGASRDLIVTPVRITA